MSIDKPTKNNDACHEGSKSPDLFGLDSTLHACVYGLDKGMVPLHAMSMNAKPLESDAVVKNAKGEDQLRFDLFKDEQKKGEQSQNQNQKTLLAYFGSADGPGEAARRAADEKLFQHPGEVPKTKKEVQMVA